MHCAVQVAQECELPAKVSDLQVVVYGSVLLCTAEGRSEGGQRGGAPQRYRIVG